MFDRVGSRWWLILIAAFIGLGWAMASNIISVPLYTGRTTLMRVGGSLVSSPLSGMSMDQVAKMATSYAVMQRAVEAIAHRRLKATPREVIESARILPIEKSRRLAVEVTLADASEATQAVGLLADAVKQTLSELYRTGDGKLNPVLKTVDPPRAVPITLEGATAYTARTTLAEAERRPAGKPPASRGAAPSLTTLLQIAHSKKVMQDAAQTLSDLGKEGYTPAKLASAVTIEPVEGTNTLAIEVTLEDPYDARQAADVVAASFKHACTVLSESGATRNPPSLRTIDPAFVFPADQHKSRKLMIGFLGGLLLGTLLAAAFPSISSKENNVVTDTQSSDL